MPRPLMAAAAFCYYTSVHSAIDVIYALHGVMVVKIMLTDTEFSLGIFAQNTDAGYFCNVFFMV